MTAIQWTDETWNPVRGCSVVSPGCSHCYAMKQAHRFSGKGKPYEGLTKLANGGPVWTGDVRMVPEVLDRPLRWRKPRRVFVNSMSDLFHESVPFPFIAAVFGVMSFARGHTFQVLTKRPVRMLEFMRWIERADSVTMRDPDGSNVETMPTVQRCIVSAAQHWKGPIKEAMFPLLFCSQVMPAPGADYARGWPLPNVWMGVSVEDQARADERIPLLLETPAAVRFLSCEPLLGHVDLYRSLDRRGDAPRCTSCGRTKKPRGRAAPLAIANGLCDAESCPGYDDPPHADVLWPGESAREFAYTHEPSLDWIIVGGESGPGARRCDVVWVRSIVEQCKAAKVPCFVKQLGSQPHFDEHREHADWLFCRIQDRKGGDPAEWPEDLRVREFPA